MNAHRRHAAKRRRAAFKRAVIRVNEDLQALERDLRADYTTRRTIVITAPRRIASRVNRRVSEIYIRCRPKPDVSEPTVTITEAEP